MKKLLITLLPYAQILMKKKNKYLLRSFGDQFNEIIKFGNGVSLFTKNNKRYLDSTAGQTGTSILGWNNKLINKSMINQIKKISHIDYKYFIDENREKLARLLISKADHKLNKVYFVGGSGGEACEAAMKLSYQYFQSIGNLNKKWFISRKQSYHGSSSDAMSVGDRPNLSLYKNFYPRFRAKISEHNKFRQKKKNETDLDYENRSVAELEKKILNIGPEKICGFIGETIMGGLVGDVPPTKHYWKKVRKICTKYNIHLIIDEVWCGTGTSGKIYCIDWDEVSPDIIFLGKTIAAGYAPVSAYLTSDKVSQIIIKKQGSIKFSTTHQGHSIGIAAALQAQKIIHNEAFLKNVIKKGKYLRDTISDELKSHEFFKNVRGRGLRNSLEYECKNKHLFGSELTEHAKNNHNLLISAKWHRVCFSPAINIENKDLDEIIEKFLKTFNEVSKNWTTKKLKSKKERVYF